MDDFGVLTQSMGIKPQGKAAPMAALKQPSRPFRHPDSKIHSFPNSPDIFDHVFSGAPKHNSFNYDADNLFGGIPGLNNYGSSHFDDVFGSFAGNQNQTSPADDDDLSGIFRGAVSRNGSTGYVKASSAGFDHLIPGSKTNGFHLNTTANQPTLSQSDDPFIILESTSGDMSPDLLDQLGRLGTSRSTSLHHSSSSGSLYDNSDPSDIFNHADKANSTRPAISHPPRPTKKAEDAASQGNSFKSADDLEYIFGTSRSNSAPRARTTNLNAAFDSIFSNGAKEDNVRHAAFSTPSSSKKDSHHTNLVDVSSLFGPGLAGDFKDIDGEPKERTKARLASHYRIQERMAQSVADLNERDLQLQQEQEERQRIADSVDADIKRWAAGREGNLRSLLSSMQYILWAGCGWQPVPLTDLITSSSVNKVYKKATLCVHPDKVQQKGANLQQKYIAEKVFHILKEAHTKFNTSERS